MQVSKKMQVFAVWNRGTIFSLVNMCKAFSCVTVYPAYKGSKVPSHKKEKENRELSAKRAGTIWNRYRNGLFMAAEVPA